MKRCWKRVLSVVLVLSLVLGMSSAAMAEDESSTTTVDIELEIGDTATYTVSDSVTESDFSSITSTVATAALESDTGVYADGSAYRLYYTSGSTTYYLTFSVSDEVLAIGTTTSSDSATEVTFDTNSYLSFSDSSGTTWYLNDTDGSCLSASAEASTAWSYDTTKGFYCTVDSVVYYLAEFAAYTASSSYSETKSNAYSASSDKPDGTSLIGYATADSGSYKLSVDINDVTNYVVLGYDTDTSSLSASLTATASDATTLYFDTSGNFYFEQDSTTYYLDINPSAGALVIETSSSRSYAAAWLYDYQYGFCCQKTNKYYLKLQMTTSDDSTTYSLALSQSASDEDGLSFLDTSAVSANTFYLSYALGGSTSTSTSTCYLKFSSGSSDVVGLTGSTSNATALSYAGGYLYFTEDDETWYLCLASDDKLGLTKSQSSATQVSYKLMSSGNWAYGFTFAAESSSSNPRYLAGTDILAESVSERKSVTFEGAGIGTTSVTVDGVTYNITVYTQIITIFTGDENIVGLTGEYSDDDLTVADSSIATASTSSTTIYSAASSVTKGSESAFKIVYETNGVEFFFLFDVSSGALTTGTTTDYGDAADVMWTSEGYLCFTGSDGTMYYLNVGSDGALTAETSGSTVWSYDSDSFTTTVDSSEVTLFSLLAATYPDGQNLTPFISTEGVYTLGYTTTTEVDDTETTTTTYITYSVSDGALTVGTSDESGTAVTYTSEGYLCFTGSDETTYYLNVDSDGTLTAGESGSTVWSYDPSAGFLCTVDGTMYYLTESGAAEASDSVSILTEETANAFALGYSTESWDFYLTWSGSVIGISTSSSLSLTYTTEGYVKFSSYYLSLAYGIVSVTTDSSEATGWSYDPENGFYVTDSSGTYYLTEFRAFTINGVTAAEAYSSTTETAGTAITITGVAEGNTTVTVTDSDENTVAKYKVYVIDNSDFVTSATTPFLSSSTTITSTKSDYTTSMYGTNSSYEQVSVTSLFLSVGLSYAITLDTSKVSSGGTWTLGSLTAAAGETVSDGTASVTVSEDGLTVTITGVSEGTTTLTYTVDDTSYTMPVTIKDYWGYDSSTTVRVHEYYMTEVKDTSAYMGVLYGETNSTVENVDFVEVTQGEVIFISFPISSASACDFFGTPDEGYALTLLGSTNSDSHYMALDSDSPEETEFITLQTAAGYNQVYYFGAAAVLSLVQAALDMDADGGMGFTRVEYGGNNTSAITVRSQQLPTVTKQIAYVKRNGEQIEYETGMAIQTGDVVYYLITVTQYATEEAITYTDVILTDTISVTHYLSFSYDSSSGSLTTEATTDSGSASTVQADDSGYLYFAQDSTPYYLYVSSTGALAATTTQSDAVTWTYDDSTGFSCTVDSVTWYLSETGVSTSAPGAYQLVTAYLDGEAVTELHTGSDYVLGYEDTTDRNAYFTTTATNTKDITDYLVSDALESDTEYYYYVYYTVVEDDTDEVLTNTVTLSYNYTSQYSSATLSSSADADASLSISQDQLTVTKNVDTTYYAQMTQVTSLSYSGLSLVSDSTKEFTALANYYYPDGDASEVTTNYWPVYYTLTSEADSTDSTTTNYTATFYYTTDGGETYVKTGQTMTMTGVASASDGTVTLTLPTTSASLYQAGTSYSSNTFTYYDLFVTSASEVTDETELYGYYYGTDYKQVYYTIAASEETTDGDSTSVTYTATLYYKSGDDAYSTIGTVSATRVTTKLSSGVNTVSWTNTTADGTDSSITLYKMDYATASYSSFADLGLLPGYIQLTDYYYKITETDSDGATSYAYYQVYFKLSYDSENSSYTVTLYYFTNGTKSPNTIGTVTATSSEDSSSGTITLTDSTSYIYSDSEDWKLYKSSDQAIDDDDVSSALASIDFVFTLYKYDSTSKTYVTVPNENYTIYENGEITGTGTTDSNGSFTLQDGQTAIFYSVDLNDENTSYYVLEDLNYLKAYNWLTTVTERTSAEDAEITFTELDSSYDMSKYRVSDTVTLTGDDAVSDSIYYVFENQYVYETTPVLDLTGDQIVLDYGLPVEISMRDNDIISYNSDDYTLSVALLNSDGKEYSSSNTEGMAGSYGTATLSDDGKAITYELTQDLTGVETICYQVTLTPTDTSESAVTDTAEIQIMPATQMYYEEDFGSTVKVDSNATAHSLIQYSSGDNSASWSTVYNSYTYSGTTATLNKSDASESEKDGTTSYAFTQEEGRVGDTSDSVYGADAAYSADAYDSENHAKKVDVSENPAAFRYYFTGTGTTIYGRTSENTAYISVKITYEGSGTVKCTDPEGTEKELSSSSNEYYTWYIDTRNVAETSGRTDSAIYGGNDDDATLYNIPVFDVSDLPYGKWKVYVYVYEAGTEVNYVYKDMTLYDTGYYCKVYDDETVGYYKVYSDGTENLYYQLDELASGTSVTSAAYYAGILNMDSDYGTLYTGTALNSGSYTYAQLFGDAEDIEATEENSYELLSNYFYYNKSDGNYYKVYYQITEDTEKSTYTVSLYYKSGDSYESIKNLTVTKAETTDEETSETTTTLSSTDTVTLYVNSSSTSITKSNLISSKATDSNGNNITETLYAPVAGSNLSKSEFYLDGVRVYNPAGTSSEVNSDYTLCAAAYASDGESNTVVLNLRDKLVNSTDTTTSSLTDAFATLTDIGSNFSSAELYEAIGPNNELYLSSDTGNGNSLTFYMLNWDLNEYQIYLGMKAPDGDPVKVSVCGEEITVANSTDQYYDISSYVTYTALDEDDSESSYAATVTISATDGLVSLTDIKVTGTSAYEIASASSSSSSSSLLELLTGDTLVFASSYVFSDADISSLIQSSQQDESTAETAEATVEATVEAEEDSSDASDTDSGSSSGSEDETHNDAEDVTDSSGDSTDASNGSGDDVAGGSSEEIAGTEDDGTIGTTPSSGTSQKKKQKITVKKASLKKTIRYKKLKKKKRTFKIKASAKGGAKLTFKKLSGNKKIKVSKKGKVTVKKGLKRGTYKVKVRISAAKTSKYKKASVTKTIKIKIK